MTRVRRRKTLGAGAVLRDKVTVSLLFTESLSPHPGEPALVNTLELYVLEDECSVTYVLTELMET